MVFPRPRSSGFQRPIDVIGVLAAVASLTAAVGCAKMGARTDAGAGGSAGGAGGAAGNAATGGTGGAGPAPCPVEGTWQLTSIACGTQDITASWFMLVPNTTVTVTDLPAGGCDMVVTSQSPVCREVVVENVGSNATGSRWQINSQGITECFPEGCRFVAVDTGSDGDAGVDAAGAGTGGVGGAGGAGGSTEDSPCMIGDRAGVRMADSISVAGDFFTATAAVSSGICQIYRLPPQITRWQRKL